MNKLESRQVSMTQFTNLFRVAAFLCLLCLLLLTGCSRAIRKSVAFPSNCIDLEAKLNAALTTLEEGNLDPRKCQVGSIADICEDSRREIERIATQCPSSGSAQYAGAILAFDRRELAKAQQLLDALLSNGGIHPDAAALRARIALEEGNVPYAIRFLSGQVRLAPADYRLRETLASAYYLARRWQEATNELQAAETLGAPAWRVAYHSGLILEANGSTDLAIRQFEKVLVERPGYRPAADRILALRTLNP